MFNRVRVNTPQIETNLDIEEDNEDILASEGEVTSLGVIQHIDAENRVVHIYDIASRNTMLLNVEGSTVLRGRFGQGIVFAEFSQGDIVNLTFDPTNNTLSSLEISNDAWERRLISGLEVNVSNNTITVGQDRFTYTDRTQVFNNGEMYNVSDIHPLNTVTMRGVGNNVWFIEIERGIGTVRVINDNQIVNGSIEIARSVSLPLGENVDTNSKEVNMPEGTHRITVRGKNISPYTDEITVRNGETTIVDLSVIPLTSGNLTITTNVPNAAIAINGRQVDISQPIALDFGEYSITAQSTGYQPFQTNITFNNVNQHLQVNLEPETVLGRIQINSNPTGAEVLIDNVYVGITPVTATIEQGNRSVTLRKDGFITTTMTVSVNDNLLPIDMELQPTVQLPPAVEVAPNPDPPVTDTPDYTFIPGPGQ